MILKDNFFTIASHEIKDNKEAETFGLIDIIIFAAFWFTYQLSN